MGRQESSSGEGADALSRAYDRFGPRLHGYLLAMTGSPEAAEDVLQEVFCRLAGRGALFEVRDVGAYLFRTARNEALRWIARRPRPEAWSDDAPEPAAGEPDKGRAGLRDAVLEALRKLPSDQAETVHLKVFENMTFEEIGRFAGCSANTAASRWRYACEKLSRLLGEWTHE